MNATFYEKCDKVLLYLKENSSGQRPDVIFPINLNELEKNTGVSFSDDVLNFLVNDKKYIERRYTNKAQYFNLTSSGMAFISHSSFVKEQSKKDEEGKLRWYETENAKQAFDDYPNIKNRAKRSEWIAILSLILAVILPMIEWKCNKNG